MAVWFPPGGLGSHPAVVHDNSLGLGLIAQIRRSLGSVSFLSAGGASVQSSSKGPFLSPDVQGLSVLRAISVSGESSRGFPSRAEAGIACFAYPGVLGL
ncbi:MAG: hypothetical protein CMJ86_10850 [Planctomycetes bacterium]|nr:hypothetical protein [Planctomycetota bacterium]